MTKLRCHQCHRELRRCLIELFKGRKEKRVEGLACDMCGLIDCYDWWKEQIKKNEVPLHSLKGKARL